MKPTALRSAVLLLTAPILGAPLACSLSSEPETVATTTAQAVEAGSAIVSGIGSKCLDDSGDSTANFNKIQLWGCNGTLAQSWSYSAGTFVGPGGKCLDVHSDDQAAGTVVDLYQCNGTDAQKWTVSGTTIKSVKGFCLDAKGGVNANGTQVQIAACDGSESQVWHVSGSTGGAPPPPAAPTLRQYNVEQTNGGSGVWEVDSVKQFKTPTQAGNTIWVVATIPNDGAQKDVTVEDTQGNTFKALDFEQDSSKGEQSVWQFYATDIKGDSSTADTVIVHWGNDNYKGVLIAEIAGVGKASLVGNSGNIQSFDAPSGDDTVTSGTATLSAAQTPALLVALSMDTYGGSSDEGGDGYAGPLSGNGFTNVDSMWNFDPGSMCTGGGSCNLATFETQSITRAGSSAGSFTARAPKTAANPGSYVSVAAWFH
jgi:hypothetical protein